ncbi:MAG: hypothetical protein GKR87_15035 [Kiritimatiellae bacterium]|nr:hypothetical protein [Kiritimatiellia bacterium]NKB25654.1 hypothetical protein [Kiritimatiellia bacterium]
MIKTVQDQYAQTGTWNMAQLEQSLKVALIKDGCNILEWLLNQKAQPDQDKALGINERCYTKRKKKVHSVLGSFEVERDYYHGPQGTCVPLDERLGLIDGYTPGLQRLMCRCGAMDSSYQEASMSLQVYGGIHVSGRQIQRVVSKVGPDIVSFSQHRDPQKTGAIPVMYISYDGTGVPMKSTETQGRKGKREEQAKTREVKLGCVFTQHVRDEEGYPLRDTQSTTYVASFNRAGEFGTLIRDEARLRGLGQAEQVVVLGDGAEWIWNVARVNFAGATQILDFYHGCEHLYDLSCILFTDAETIKSKAERWKKVMKENGAWIRQLNADFCTNHLGQKELQKSLDACSIKRSVRPVIL